MSADTIDVLRHPMTGELLNAVDVCYSPDEGIWWLSQADFKNKRGATNIGKNFKTREAAVKAYRAGKIRWEWH
jgi:hypothetical protein